MTTALITGIASFLGRELANQLQKAGYQVHGLVRPGSALSLLEGMAVTLHVLADAQTSTVISIFEEVRPDVVIHLASTYRREHKPEDVVTLAVSNIQFGMQILDAMRLTGCRRFVGAGSFFQRYQSDDYGALNLYAATKQAFLDILKFYADAWDMHAVWLLLYEVYSEVDTRRKLLTVMAQSWAKGEVVNLPEEEFWLDLVHVEDVAGAFVHACQMTGTAAGKGVDVFCVRTGRETSSAELIHLFETIGGRPMTVRRGTFKQPDRVMDRTWPGPVLPGWQPQVSLEEGIRRLIDSVPRQDN